MTYTVEANLFASVSLLSKISEFSVFPPFLFFALCFLLASAIAYMQLALHEFCFCYTATFCLSEGFLGKKQFIII